MENWGGCIISNFLSDGLVRPHARRLLAITQRRCPGVGVSAMILVMEFVDNNKYG